MNGTEDELAAWYEACTAGLSVWPALAATAKYLVLGVELGASGNLHLQGFVQFTDRKTLAGAKRELFAHIRCPHLERRRGTALEASDYCKKSDTAVAHEFLAPLEWGELQAAGQRTDLEAVAAALVSREMTVQDIAESAPSLFVRNYRGLQVLADKMALPYNGGPKTVVVYYGPTGCGKTRKAFLENPTAYFWGPEQGKWFQNYGGEDVTIMDEFRGQLPFGFILRLTDSYPMIVEMKGSSTQFSSSTIIFCSPAHPKLWYPSLDTKEGRIDQLMRRITQIKWMGEGEEPEVVMPEPNFQQFS